MRWLLFVGCFSFFWAYEAQTGTIRGQIDLSISLKDSLVMRLLPENQVSIPNHYGNFEFRELPY